MGCRNEGGVRERRKGDERERGTVEGEAIDWLIDSW